MLFATPTLTWTSLGTPVPSAASCSGASPASRAASAAGWAAATAGWAAACLAAMALSWPKPISHSKHETFWNVKDPPPFFGDLGDLDDPLALALPVNE